MEFTFSWLKKFLKTEATLEQVVGKLNEIGLEVNEVIDPSKDLDEFIIAQIINIEPHPSSSKLNVCTVFNGSQNLQIVCGASNARRDLKVVLAPIGSVIPANNLKIKLSKIRDIESQGMLCSAAELLLGSDSDGIIELDSDAPIGEKFVTYMKMDDSVIKIDITPNRGDCSGVYGVARDLAAVSIGELEKLNYLEYSTLGGENDSAKDLVIDVKNREECDTYFATIIENLQNNQSPKWLVNYLKAIGVKSISAPVDITNYIMYSFGQPLHAYDLSKIQGNISVRKAQINEKFISLDNKEYSLTQNDLVIADERKVIALAGIIGGQESSCEKGTNSIILEAANFNSNSITISARRHSIDTKSKYRYERKIDKNFVETANNLAIQLILEICGGEVKKTAKSIATYTPRFIRFNFNDLRNIGGISIDKPLYEKILLRLGFRIYEADGDNYNLEIPSWRNDIAIKEDVVEEIVRIYGYDNIPSTDFVRKSLITSSNLLNNPIYKAKVIASELGYNEVVSWSFMDKRIAEWFSNISADLEITNPISSELNYMRPTILPNLLEMVKKNQARDIEDLNLFEVGPIFNVGSTHFEQQSFAAILSGFNRQNNIYQDRREYDVYDIKFLVEEVLSLYGYQLSNLLTSFEAPKYYHPTRSIVIYLDKKPIVVFGEVNPFILRNFSIKRRVYAAEFLLDFIAYKPKKNKVSFSNYQAVERDFAFILAKKLPAGNLLKAIYKANPLIRDAEIFDSYKCTSLGEDKKSIAIKVTLLSENKTLTDNEIKEVSDQIIEKAKNVGAELRG